MAHPAPRSLVSPLNPSPIVVASVDRHALDLLRAAVLRSDDVVALVDEPGANVRRFVDQFAVELNATSMDEVLKRAGAVLVSLDNTDAENEIVRAARKAHVPVHVRGRDLVSDFTLLEFLEQRPLAALAA